MDISIDTNHGHTNGYTNGHTNGNGTAHDSPQEPIAAQMPTNGIYEDALKTKTPAYKVHEEPMGSKRKLKVIFMGMGSSGINFAHQAAKRLENVEVVCYEKNSDLGGTWLENRYPGCACDIPSVCYQYSWQRKPDWSKYYSGSKEIYDYFRWVAETNNVIQYAKFNHQIIRAEFIDSLGQWKVTVMRNGNPNDTFDDFAEFFIHGGGVLNNWKWPDVKGLHDFKGPVLHTARWDATVELEHKRVLVIGAGSSGVQTTASIIDKVDQLFVVARSAIWVTAGFGPKYAGENGENFSYSDETKDLFRDNPELYLRYCKAIESELNVRFKFYINGSQDAIEAREFSIKEMQKKLESKPELIDHLIPSDFGVGCRRPTPGNGFLEALCNSKTTVLTKTLQGVTESGFIAADGSHHEVDVIICATGFDTTFRPRFPIICNGFDLQEKYGTRDIVGYLGLSAPEVPNYFIYLGPYGPLGHGSVVPMVEAYTDYIMQVIEKVQHDRIKKLQVKASVAQEFTTHADEYLKRTAFSGPCSSWFKAGDRGRKPVCWPGSRVHYMTMLQHPRFEDFEMEYLSGNRFNFLGNGFDMREEDGRDLTWYYGLIDEKDRQPDWFPNAMY